MEKSGCTMQTKNAFYFSHDSNARNDSKIINLRMHHGAAGYGIYFMLIEMLMESTNYSLETNYLALAFVLHSDKEVVRSVIEDFHLFDFSENRQSFFSPSLNKRVAPLEQIREKRRLAGIRSGEVRRAKALRKANVQQSNESYTVKEGIVSDSSDKGKQLEVNRVVEDSVDKVVNTANKSSFVKPTEKEVSDYCIHNEIDVDASLFVCFYESKGWMVGRNKMKDWRAAVRRWSRTDLLHSEKRRRGIANGKGHNIGNYQNNKVYEQF